MNIRQALENTTVFAAASPATMASVVSCAVVCTYGKNELIFREKEDIGTFYFVAKGLVYLSKLNHHEEERIIFFCKEGEMLNEVIVDGHSASATAMTLTEAVIVKIPAKEMKFLMRQDAGLSEAVMCSMAVKIRRLYHQMKNTNNSVRLEQQIAAKLWKLAKDYGAEENNGIRIPFDLSITLLANMAGSKRETVSRVVKKLSVQGLIVVRGKSFLIPDKNRLLEFFHET